MITTSHGAEPEEKPFSNNGVIMGFVRLAEKWTVVLQCSLLTSCPAPTLKMQHSCVGHLCVPLQQD